MLIIGTVPINTLRDKVLSAECIVNDFTKQSKTLHIVKEKK